MEMYFVTKVKWSNLLFKGINVNNVEELVGACIITFLATVVFEALKLLKLYLALRLNENPLANVENLHSQDTADHATATTNEEVVLLSSLRFPVTVRQIRIHKIVFHILSSLSHTVNYFYGYLLMLLVMTYSVWLTIAVILGAGAGYFVFGAIRHTLQFYHQQQQTSSPTNCNEGHQRTHSVEAGPL